MSATTSTTKTLELERCKGTKREFVAYLDLAKHPGVDLSTVDKQVEQFKKDLSDWLDTNNEWGNVHVVSQLHSCILLSCDEPIARRLALDLPFINQVQEWIEK